MLKTVVESDRLIDAGSGGGGGVFLCFKMNIGVRIAVAQTITTVAEIIPALILIRSRENNRRIALISLLVLIKGVR